MYKFIDLHCDTLTTSFENDKNLFENDLHLDIKKLKFFKNSIQVFAIWLNKKYYNNAFKYTNKIINFYESELEKNKNFIEKIYTRENLINLKKSSKLGSILSIEGGESLEGNLDNLSYFYNKGVRILTLCWNYENEIGHGVFSKSEEGLKEFGKNLIDRMNSLNMLVDVSHLNEAGFWNVYNISAKPFIASHSNSYTICNNRRNLKDEQIKAIEKKGGLIGINLYPKFLNNTNKADIGDILKHIEYMINLIGTENICLGGDLDGIDITPYPIKNVLDYEILFKAIEKKFGIKVCEKICFENSYNFFQNLL